MALGFKRVAYEKRMIKGKKGISHAWDPLREGFCFV